MPRMSRAGTPGLLGEYGITEPGNVWTKLISWDAHKGGVRVTGFNEDASGANDSEMVIDLTKDEVEYILVQHHFLKSHPNFENEEAFAQREHTRSSDWAGRDLVIQAEQNDLSFRFMSDGDFWLERMSQDGYFQAPIEIWISMLTLALDYNAPKKKSKPRPKKDAPKPNRMSLIMGPS